MLFISKALRNLFFSVAIILFVNFSFGIPESSAGSLDLIKLPYASVLPTIDGNLEKNEWDDSKKIQTSLDLISLQGKAGESHPFKLFLKNDADFLYIAGQLENEEADGTVDNSDFRTLLMDSFSILFDNNNNKRLDPGEDKKVLYILNAQPMVMDAHYLSESEKEQGASEEHEPQNITGIIKHTGGDTQGTYIFEIKIPLSSPDKQDIQIAPGDKIRWNISYFDKFSPTLKGTLIGGLYGIDLENSSNWGNIQLAQNNKKTVSSPTVQKKGSNRRSINIVGQILNEKDISSSNLRFVGKHFDLVLTMFPFKRVSDALRRENPNITILLFNNPYFAFGEKFWNSKAGPEKTAPRWVLRDKNGKFIPYGGPTYEGMDIDQSNIPMMDIRNKEWQRYFASQTRKHILAGNLDGVFIDTMSEEIPPFALTRNKDFPAGFNANVWRQANYDLLNEIKNQLQGTGALVYYNGISDPPGLKGDALNKGFMDVADGTALEAFSIYLSVDSSEQARRWYLERLILTDMQAVVDRKKGLVVEVYGETDDFDHRIFALASFLLLQNEKTYFYYTVRNEAGDLKWRPEWDANLGKSLGKYKRDKNILVREFENARVYVNAGTTTVQIPLDKTYKSLHGKAVTKLTLEPLSGSIIINR